MTRLNTAYHAMTIHLAMGILFVITAIVLVAFFISLKDKDHPFLKTLDATLLVMLFFGIAGICIATITPFMDYPDWSALVMSPLVRMKIFLAVICFEVFLTMYYLRWKHGVQMWGNHKLALYFLILAVGGSILLSLEGGIGGYITVRETALEPLLHALGIAIP